MAAAGAVRACETGHVVLGTVALVRLIWARLRLCVLLLVLATAGSAQASAGQGFVESLQWQAEGSVLQLKGWAAPEKRNVFTTHLIVEVAGQQVYGGRFERSERADVVAGTGRPDWLWSGWAVRIHLPRDLPSGPQMVRVSMRLGSGEVFELVPGAAGGMVDLPARAQVSRLSTALLLASVLLPAVGWAWGARPFGVALALSFACLVVGGWSGSSLGLALDASAPTRHSAEAWRGENRPVRSDEWEVLTPFALAQQQHEPRWPVVNTHLGHDGQNMMVVGMTGVPVAHVSSLAKPATWGFFAFDLRRALAWHWWWPFFACFAALWAVLVRYFGLPWRSASALALLGTTAPYSVAFSGWPAYLLSFACAGMLGVRAVLNARAVWAGAVWGVCSGLAAAGYALVLYPAWQISVAYLVLPLTGAVLVAQRGRLAWGKAQWLGLGLALLTLGGLMGAWWEDAGDAVTAVRGTLYPGARSIEAGGDIDRWFLLKGWLAPVTMYRDSSLMVPSDAASFVLLLVPLLLVVPLRWLMQRRVDGVSAWAWLVTAWVLVFMYVGLGEGVARWTLWGSTTVYRMDLVLGLAQVFLLAWLMARDQVSPPVTEPGRPNGRLGLAPLGGLVLAAVVLGHVWWQWQRLPVAVSAMVPIGFVWLAALAMVGASLALYLGRHGLVVGVLLAWTLAASLPFNPVGRATQALSLSGEARSALSALSGPGRAPRVAVLGDRVWAMTLPAAGVPVSNTVFYYPQTRLWQRLDPDGAQSVVYNRYHRLLLVPGEALGAEPYVLDTPRLDEVRLTVDPRRFDFALLDADGVWAAPSLAPALADNPGLESLAQNPGWVLFRVRH